MPQSLPFAPKITQAGLNAAVSAAGLQVSVQVTHIALGTGQYNPVGTETALQDRRIVSPIAGGGEIAPTQLRLHAAFQANPGQSFACGEVGFYLGHPDSGGTLLAVYSSADPALQPVVYVSDQFLVTTSYTLGLSALPSGSVTVLVDQNAQAILLLIGNHEQADDPHGDRAFAVMADRLHTAADHPHQQYLRSTDLEAIAIYTLKKEYSGGGVYTTYDDTRSPAEILGFGTWVMVGVGRVFVGQDPANVAFATIGQQGGEETHTLTAEETPAHTHFTLNAGTDSSIAVSAANTMVQRVDTGGAYSYEARANDGATISRSSSVGGGAAHNNLQPYEVVRKWRCTSVSNVGGGGGGGGGGAVVPPAAFSFSPAYNQALGATVTSNTVVISGLAAPGAISIIGGSYSVNGGAPTAVSGSIANGDTLALVATASGTYSTTTSVSVTVNGYSTTWQIATQSAPGVDTVPNAFSFSSQSGVSRNAAITSASQNISGINAATPISVSGGSYSVNGGPFTSSVGTVVAGDFVRAQVQSASGGLVSTSATVTIGGVSATFTVTTSSSGSFSATASPNPVSVNRDTSTGPGSIVSSVTLNVVNGTAPYTTTVTLLEDRGGADLITVSQTSPTLIRFSSSGNGNLTREGTYQITISDSAGNSMAISVPVYHTYFNYQ
ncbi:hypothetical protein [Nevskia sp.]|uniref:phage baseplate protein n=1 Tax=Nevskia sp. TaxID=1929292 RepID=UPI0025D01C3F|nr:hypothetical protein [Nevskia sp.]